MSHQATTRHRPHVAGTADSALIADLRDISRPVPGAGVLLRDSDPTPHREDPHAGEFSPDPFTDIRRRTTLRLL